MSWRQILHKIVSDNWHIKALSLIAAVLIVYFNNTGNLEERTVVVPLEVRLPIKHLPAGEILDSVRVTLRGESDDIISILSEDIHAFIDLTLYQESGLYDISVQIERKGDALNVDPLTITSRPAQLSIRLEDQITKEAVVTADIQGALATGYQLTKTSIIPHTVEISGPRNVLDRVSEISTQGINVSNRAASGSTRAQLIIPGPYVEFPNRNSVNVVFEVKEVPIIRNIENVEVGVVNLRRRFVSEYELGNSFVVARAFPSQLDQLSGDNVRFIVDAKGISSSGQYTLDLIPQVSPQLQGAVEIVDYQPKTLALTVETQ